MLDSLWEETQIASIRKEVAVAATGAQVSVELMRQDFVNLSERLDRLALICRAMHELLVEQGLYDEGRLRTKIVDIDLRDGQKDGKFTPPQKRCPKCDAMICHKFNRCLFCGYEDRSGSPFNSAA